MNLSALIAATTLSLAPMTAMAGDVTIITPPIYGINGAGNYGYTPSFGGPAGALATMPGPEAGQGPDQKQYKAPPKPGSMQNFDSITVGKSNSGRLQAGQQISGTATATSGNTISINGINLVLSNVPNGGYIAQRKLSNILSTGPTTCTIINPENPITAECSIIGQSINSAMGNAGV